MVLIDKMHQQQYLKMRDLKRMMLMVLNENIHNKLINKIRHKGKSDCQKTYRIRVSILTSLFDCYTAAYINRTVKIVNIKTLVSFLFVS